MDAEISQFTDEAAALEEIRAAGFYPLTLDFPAERNNEHWHDFDAMTYVIEGEVTITATESGEDYVCAAGTKIVAPAGVLHRETTSGYRAIIGFSIDPATLSQPVNKQPPVNLD